MKTQLLLIILAGVLTGAGAQAQEDARFGPFKGKFVHNPEMTDHTAEIRFPRVLVGGTSYVVYDDSNRSSDVSTQGKAAAICLSYGYARVLDVQTELEIFRQFRRPMNFSYSWIPLTTTDPFLRIDSITREKTNAPFIHSVLCGE